MWFGNLAFVCLFLEVEGCWVLIQSGASCKHVNGDRGFGKDSGGECVMYTYCQSEFSLCEQRLCSPSQHHSAFPPMAVEPPIAVKRIPQPQDHFSGRLEGCLGRTRDNLDEKQQQRIY